MEASGVALHWSPPICSPRRRYGVLVLVVEIMGASTVVLYGINLLFTPDPPTYEPDPARPGLPKVRLLKHSRACARWWNEAHEVPAAL